MSFSAGTALGPYQIVGLLGAGGMGEVYRASDARLKRDVALKVIADSFAHDQALIARFQREAELLATLTHQHIAAVYGLEEIDGGRALVMELAEGETLAQRLTRGALPLDEALPIARQIADALEYAHDHGILHRDLKPANIKVGSDGHVKILDFGLAKAMDAPGAGAASNLESPTITSPAFTQAGMIIGTAAYMSPEQARGRAVDRRTDIWAFGCVLLEMITGRRTFDGETVTDTLAAVLTRDVSLKELPTNTPVTIRHLLERTLTRDSRLRLQSIGEARIAIDQAIASPSASAANARQPRQAIRLLPWAVTAAALIAVAVVGWRGRSIPSVAPDQVTFQIPFPPGLPLGAFGRPELSPDERRIAIVSRTGTIWMHELATSRWTEMKNETTSHGVIWSPDGRSFAYLTDAGALLALDLASGASRRIAQLGQIQDSARGSWCESGNIFIAVNKDRTSKLLSVPAAGGNATTVAEADPARGEIAFARPQCLQSGRIAVLVRLPSNTWVTRFGDASRLAARPEPDLPGAWTLLDEQRGFRADDGVLFYQATDTQHRPIGEPAVVVGDVRIDDLPLMSAGNHAIVYRSTEAENQRQFAWFDRHGGRIGVVDLAGGARNPQLSGDGRLLAFETFQGTSSRRDIHVLRFADSQRQQITDTRVDNADAQWSANTGQLMFAREIDGLGSFFIRDLAGTTERPVTAVAPALNQWLTDWSSDGTKVVYSENGLSCVLVGLNGTEPKVPVRYAGADSCQVSPNGKYISYVDLARSGSVVVEPLPPSGARWQISAEAGSEPRWHPNGKELFFLDVDQTMMSSEITLDPEFKAGPPQPLFRTKIPAPMRTGVSFNYDVAPDGRFLINTVKPGTEPQSLHVILNWRPQGASAGTR